MGDDDGGMQWFQQLGLEQFNEIFRDNEVKTNEHSDNDIRTERHRKIYQPTQHESSGNLADSDGSKATPF